MQRAVIDCSGAAPDTQMIPLTADEIGEITAMQQEIVAHNAADLAADDAHRRAERTALLKIRSGSTMAERLNGLVEWLRLNGADID